MIAEYQAQLFRGFITAVTVDVHKVCVGYIILARRYIPVGRDELSTTFILVTTQTKQSSLLALDACYK